MVCDHVHTVFCDMKKMMISFFPFKTLFAYYYYGSFYRFAFNGYLFFQWFLSLHSNANTLGSHMLSTVLRISTIRTSIVSFVS